MRSLTVSDADADDSSWNSRFQRMWTRTARTFEGQVTHAVQLTAIVDAFFVIAERVVRTIVDERGLPEEQKTIRSIDAGGVAGGQKFLVDGVFFKYALDNVGLYGGDEYAMKVCDDDYVQRL